MVTGKARGLSFWVFSFFLSFSAHSSCSTNTSPLLFEWECVPEKVAYHHPYIIGFAKDFIEIHHVDTASPFLFFFSNIRIPVHQVTNIFFHSQGSLEQIITGKLCRLTYEGFDDDDDKPVVHGCIFQTRDTPKTQHIFQLEVQQ